MTFYVNEVKLPQSDWSHQCIGLFDNNEWDGRGNFCGYYASEFYLNTTLLAYGIQLKRGNQCYDPKTPFNGGFYENTNKYFSEVQIGSGLWEEHIEADSVKEAIEIFKAQSW